jgi:hypothetical protein
MPCDLGLTQQPNGCLGFNVSQNLRRWLHQPPSSKLEASVWLHHRV